MNNRQLEKQNVEILKVQFYSFQKILMILNRLKKSKIKFIIVIKLFNLQIHSFRSNFKINYNGKEDI